MSGFAEKHGIHIIDDHADAHAVLHHTGSSRLQMVHIVQSMSQALGVDSRALEDFIRLNLLGQNEPMHRGNRRFVMRFVAELADLWPDDRLATIYRTMLEGATRRERVDLNTDLNEAFVCRIFGARYGCDAGLMRETMHLTRPMVEAHFKYKIPRVNEILDWVKRADQAESKLSQLNVDFVDMTGVDPSVQLKLSTVGTLAPGFLLVDMLNKALLRLADDPDIAPRLAADHAGIMPFLRDVLRTDPSITHTSPTRTDEDILLPSGRILKEGDIFQGDIKRANDSLERRDDAKSGQTGISFGAGPHRCVGAGLTFRVMSVAVRVLVSDFALHRVAAATDAPGDGIPVRISNKGLD